MKPPADWSLLRTALTTADTGSLSAAARALGLSQPTVGRQISALEAQLGVALFERSGHKLLVTPTGRAVLDEARNMQTAAARIALLADGQSQDLTGRVTITASDMFSAHALPRALKALRQTAPNLEIEIIAVNEIQDIARREADIAIRHVRPTEDSLFARLIREDRAHFYASDRYLAEASAPLNAETAPRHSFISMGDTARMISYMKELGLSLTEANYRLGSENGIVAWELARAGLGIVPMTEEVGDATPGMTRVLTELPEITFPVWLVTHRELHTSRKIRLVFDHLAKALARA